MKAKIVGGVLFFGFDDGSSMTCECIKDEAAKKIADAVFEMHTRHEATKDLALKAIALIKL